MIGEKNFGGGIEKSALSWLEWENTRKEAVEDVGAGCSSRALRGK